MAECFWPDVRQELVEQAVRRIERSAAELTHDGTRVELTETILLPENEVVFYLFNGSAEARRDACERAKLPFERAVESVRPAGH